MSENDRKKLEFILEKIADLASYRARYGSVESLLNDKMGWDAAIMCIQQIGETLKHKLSPEFQAQFGGRLPISEAYWTRNYIAHDYENVDKQIIETIIREELEKVKQEIVTILESPKGSA